MPACYLPLDYIGYKVKDIKREATHISVTLERQVASGFPNDVQTVSVQINFLNNNALRIKLLDSTKNRYEVPVPKLNLPKTPDSFETLYEVDVTESG
jgi:hypothetical protein